MFSFIHLRSYWARHADEGNHRFVGILKCGSIDDTLFIFVEGDHQVEIPQWVVQQTSTKGCVTEKLPDGSSAIFDSVTNVVHALNETAAAAFEACREPVTLSGLSDAMRRRLGPVVTVEMALEAVAELERAGLVTSSGTTQELRNSSRRQLLKAAGVALPVVLSLTAVEQRVFAAGAGSGIGAASIASISQTSVECDDTYDSVTITGLNTHFTNSSVVSFNPPLMMVNSVSVTNATSLTVNFYVGITGEDGFPVVTSPAQLNVIVTTGSEVATGTGLVNYVCD